MSKPRTIRLLREMAREKRREATAIEQALRAYSGDSRGEIRLFHITDFSRYFEDQDGLRAWYDDLSEGEQLELNGAPAVHELTPLPDGRCVGALARGSKSGRHDARCAPEAWNLFVAELRRGASVVAASAEASKYAKLHQIACPTRRTLQRRYSALLRSFPAIFAEDDA